MLKYKVGDRVRIVSKWADPEWKQNWDGAMDCWLGKTMTVAYVNGYNYRMMEDNGSWWWNDSLIAGLAEAPESIHITRDGNTVHAVHKRGDKVVGRASAKCSPDDTFDFAVGAKLAVERVFASSSEPKTPKTRDEIMRKYLGMTLDDLADRICDNRPCAQCPIFQKNVGSDDNFCCLWAAKHSDAAKYLIAAKLTEEELEAQKKC